MHVNFPFITRHPTKGLLRTNARENQTFDQIGLFFREDGLPTHLENENINKNEKGPDYGVFNFVKLFQDALDIKPNNKKAFYSRFEHKVSDHMPLWLRLCYLYLLSKALVRLSGRVQ